MTTVKYSVPSIHCGHCIRTIEMELGEISGVSKVKADWESKMVEIDFAPPASEEIVVATLNEINYPPVIEK